MKDNYIHLKKLKGHIRKQKFKKIGKGLAYGAGILGKEVMTVNKAVLKKAFKKPTMEDLKRQEEKLKAQVRVSQQKAKLAKLKAKTGTGAFGKFQKFATDLSKLKIAKGVDSGFKPGKKKTRDLF